MTFEKIKKSYEGKIVTENEFEEIALNECVKKIENNGNSGVYNNTWYTAYSNDDEFDFYG